MIHSSSCKSRLLSSAELANSHSSARFNDKAAQNMPRLIGSDHAVVLLMQIGLMCMLPVSIVDAGDIVEPSVQSANVAVDLCASRAESAPFTTSDFQAKLSRIEHKVSFNATVRLECHICFDKESVYTRAWFRRSLKYVEDLKYGFYAEQFDDEMKPIDAVYIVPGAFDTNVVKETAEDAGDAADVAVKPKFRMEFGTHDLLINRFSLDDQAEYHCRTHEYREREPDFIYFVTAKLDFKPAVVKPDEIRYAVSELFFPGEDGVNAWLITPRSQQKYRVILGKIDRINDASNITHAHDNRNQDKGWNDCNRCDAWGMKSRNWQCRIILPQRFELMTVNDRRYVTACQFQFEGHDRGVWPLPLVHHPQGADLEDRRWVLRACFEAQRQLFPQFETIVADDLELYADRARGVHSPNSTRYVLRQFLAASVQGFACNDGRRYAVMQKLTNGMFPARADLAGWVESQSCFVKCESLPNGGAELKTKFELEANVDLQHIKEFESSGEEKKVTKTHFRYFAGEQVTLLCPNTSYNRMVVWMNETRPLSPFTLANETQNRVEIDSVSRLVIHIVEEADEAVYSCWQNEVLFAKLTLQVDDRSDVVIPDYWLAVWYLNVVMFFNFTMFLSLLIVMCKRYRGFVTFSTETYGGEDVERIKNGDVDSGTASSNDDKRA